MVMFLHLSVSHSVHSVYPVNAGTDTPQADTPLGRHPPWQTPLSPADTPLEAHPPPTATAADGTHPTRMLSCN